MKTQTWYFFAIFNNGTKKISAIQNCKNPSRTKNYKLLLEILEFDNIESIGYSLEK
jgi:hypothetical protein